MTETGDVALIAPTPAKDHTESDTGTRLAHFDGWRGVAILGVLVDHFGFSQVINLGRLGVELFFVLSGLLMAEILFVRKVPLSRFFARRISRTWPALIVFVGALFLMSHELHWFDINRVSLLAALTFTTNYVESFVKVSPLIDHTWSLCIEEHVYLLLALIAAARRKIDFSVPLLAVALAAAAILNGVLQTFVLGHGYYDVYWRTDVRGASILIGVACYLYFREPGRIPEWLKGRRALVALACLALMLNVNIVPDAIKYSLGTVLLAVALNTLIYSGESVLAILRSPMLTRVGIWSYSIYVWQQPLAAIYAWHQPFSSVASHGLRIAGLPVAIGLACVSYYFIEQPARRALNRCWNAGELALAKRSQTLAAMERADLGALEVNALRT